VIPLNFETEDLMMLNQQSDNHIIDSCCAITIVMGESNENRNKVVQIVDIFPFI